MSRRRKVGIIVLGSLVTLLIYTWLYLVQPVVFGFALLLLILIGFGAVKLSIADTSISTFYDNPSSTDPMLFRRFRGPRG